MEAVTVLAPAKLNLTLGVTGFAENGYHTLDMLCLLYTSDAADE